MGKKIGIPIEKLSAAGLHHKAATPNRFGNLVYRFDNQEVVIKAKNGRAFCTCGKNDRRIRWTHTDPEVCLHVQALAGRIRHDIKRWRDGGPLLEESIREAVATNYLRGAR